MSREWKKKPAPTEQYVKMDVCLCLRSFVVRVQGTLFELVISQALHGCKLYGLSGGCAMQIECTLTHGGGVSRGNVSVEERLLGRGHEFMHEHERGAMLAYLPPWALGFMAQWWERGGGESRIPRLKPAVVVLKLFLYNLRLLCDPSRPFWAYVSCRLSSPNCDFMGRWFQAATQHDNQTHQILDCQLGPTNWRSKVQGCHSRTSGIKVYDLHGLQRLTEAAMNYDLRCSARLTELSMLSQATEFTGWWLKTNTMPDLDSWGCIVPVFNNGAWCLNKAI
ncbi:uncharacterized protein LY89DRAFT_676867 [Mollisia scopiformis]|uniref:Uncharacterized protein n=1 Tax=Mollisia scopiformis TaxID=149040 RepID=A0A132B7R8_MOLSC|nr:uncharacterized protein LY89DRAFT_676867 [Mollisia scopiformis]KUJ08450.1 hypothetical protein LY89DRAFT_676867 [Mollisia scopiformis]